MKILYDLINLYKALSKNYDVILFSENSILYKKIFRNFEIFLKENKVKYLLITLNDNLKIKYNLIDNHSFYINFNNLDFLKIFFKNIKKKLIISSTPKFNKKISHKSNYLIYLQHSLGRLTNKYLSNNLRHFDKVTIVNKDQLYDCINQLKINKKKLLNYKYHNHNFLIQKKKKLNKLRKTILIASSFYGNHLLSLIDSIFIEKLLTKYKIILRPHPEITKNFEMLQKLEILKKKFTKNDFSISWSPSNEKDILEADYLVTDFSGIGITFSLSKATPTIFLLKSRLDYKNLEESYSTQYIKNIAIVDSFSFENLIKSIEIINKKKKYFREKINKFQFNQFNFFHENLDIKKFVIQYLGKSL